MKLPHTITVFNRINGSGKTRFAPTVIKGCLNRIVYATPKSVTGEENGNGTKLYIPLTADTSGKRYISPEKYKQLTDDDRNGFYTFSPDNDFYTVGAFDTENTNEIDTATIKGLSTVYKITAAELLDFGDSSLQHWEVQGR